MDSRQHSDNAHAAHVAPDRGVTWTIPDLIDFEHYLDVDERRLRDHPSARKSLIERDHGIYQDEIAPTVSRFQPHTLPHRRASLRGWLAARRNAEDPHLRPLLPGAAFGGAQRLVAIVIILVGLLLGYGVASALLSYDGTRPVGIAWYLFLLVGVQLGLVLSVVVAWVVRRMRGGGTLAPPSLLTHAIRPLLSKATQWLQGQRLGHATAELQERVKAQHGVLKSQYALYGPVSYLPLLIQAQLFGVAFNLGVVLTTILLELFTDLAFGWGSTLNVHPQTIYDLTRLVALPWGWLFGEGVGYPSLEQVAGSRIILEHWATATPTIKPDPTHLRAWGSFLVLAVITYGLLPRLLLLGGSIAAQAYVLARLSFTHAGSQALYGRMLSPRLETTMGGTATVTEMPIPTPDHARGRRAGSADAPTAPTPTEVSRPWRNALVRQGRGATTAKTSPVTDVTPKVPPSVEVKPSAPMSAPPAPRSRPAAEAPSAREPVTRPPAAAATPRHPEPRPEPAARPAAEPEPVPRLFAKPKPAEQPAPETRPVERPTQKPAPVERTSVAAAPGERPTGKPVPIERPPTVVPPVEPPAVEPTPLASPAPKAAVVEVAPHEPPAPRTAPVEPPAVEPTVTERAVVEAVLTDHLEPEAAPLAPPKVAPPPPEPALVETAPPEPERPEPEVAPVQPPAVLPAVAGEAASEAAPSERPEPEVAQVVPPLVEPTVVAASAVAEQPLEQPIAERTPAEVPQIQPPAVEAAPAEQSIAPPAEIEQPAVEAAPVEPPRVEVALTEQPETEPPGAGSLAPDLGPRPEPPPLPLPLAPTAPPAVGRAGGVRYAPDACLLLLHVDVDDVLEDEDRPRLEQMLLELTGWRVGAVATFGAGTAMNDEAIGMLEGGDWEAPPSRVALIEDGSQPPITESLRFLRELRQAAGTRAQILLALVGDPTDEDRLPPIRAFDFTDWQRKIDQMADPYLRLEMLAPPSEDGES